uniref:EF-hand domain-containing protein n=1 Tax=Setaria italica TaxID=4555 RepID=K3Y137_SETIT
SHDDATKGQSSSSTADVYSGELTPLQRHVAFFDRDKDGVIYPSETYQGFRAIGCGVALSAASAVFINAGLGPSTKPENQKTPPFKFPIYVKNIHKGKHGSDSGVYDANGRTCMACLTILSGIEQRSLIVICSHRKTCTTAYLTDRIICTVKKNFIQRKAFPIPYTICHHPYDPSRIGHVPAAEKSSLVPEKFEEIFKKHAHTKPDALTGKELQEMLQANREPKDFKGWLGGLTEWKVLYSLCKDKDGFLHKDTVRAVYDGSLFERLEQERKAKKEFTKKK